MKFFRLGDVLRASSLVACVALKADDPVETPKPKPTANCERALPPEAPSATGTGGADVPSIYAAIKSFDRGSASAPVGFDQDGLCTCPIDPPTCKGQQSICDLGDAGIDNAIGLVFDSAKSSFPILEGINAHIGAGDARGIILRLDNYDGTSDDPQVTLAIYESTGVETLPPTWTESDRWKVDTSVTFGNPPLAGAPDGRIANLLSTKAYVRNGTVVAPFPNNASLRLTTAFSMVLQRAWLTARVERKGTTFALSDALLSGVWASADLFRALRNLDVPGPDETPICQFPTLEAKGREVVCQALDLTVAQTSDVNIPCDAASFALRAELVPASLGRNEPTNAFPIRCAEAALDCNKE